jgi:hypothetical protein
VGDDAGGAAGDGDATGDSVAIGVLVAIGEDATCALPEKIGINNAATDAVRHVFIL